MEILQNYDLTGLNTFGVSARARFFAVVQNEQDLRELFASDLFKKNEKFFLGSGSNVLFTKDFEGMVVLNKLKGIEIEKENDEDVYITAKGGENWHDLVSFCVSRGYWGVENLSLIPGTVGAAPMQNIGAYGAEIKNVLEKVEAFEIETGNKRIFSREECELGYRDSVFKNKLKGKYFISAIILKLSKVEKKNISYQTLKEYLEKPTEAKATVGKNKIIKYTPKIISDAVISIRRSKLPDPKVIGNAGSFFKNVFVTKEKLEELKLKYPEITFYEEDKLIKIPAGWLIEKCGPVKNGASWKGYREGNVGVHERQALVIVNHGGATGEEIKKLSEQIIASVFSKFGLKLVPEVNLI